MEKIRLLIAGEEYNIGTDDDLDYVAQLGAELNEKISGLMSSNVRISVTQAAIVTALEYADAYLPTDGLFYSAFMTEDSNSFTDDCIHPNAHGSEFIGRKYAEYIRPVIDKLIK